MDDSESIVIVYPPPFPVNPEAAAKASLDATIRCLKEVLDEPMFDFLHKNAKTLLDMYESGILSPTQDKTIYVQDGVVYDSPPAPRDGLHIWTEETNPKIVGYQKMNTAHIPQSVSTAKF